MTEITDNIVSKDRKRSLTSTESLTLSGNRFHAEVTVTLSSGADPYYVLFQMPDKNSGLTVGLSARQFKSQNGDASLEILWESTGIAGGDDVPVYNENNASKNTSQMVVKSNITVTSDGTVRESDFLSGTGAGASSSGDVAPDLGFRLYKPGTFFIAKITNEHNLDNKIKISYTWEEAPLNAF